MCRARFSDRPPERRFPVRVLDGVGEGRGRPLAEILRSLPCKTVAVGALRVRWPGRDEGEDRSRECVLPSDGAEIPDEMDEI